MNKTVLERRESYERNLREEQTSRRKIKSPTSSILTFNYETNGRNS